MTPAVGARPRLLFLSQRIPYPPDKGEKIRAYRMLLHLRRDYEVHLGCLIDDPRDLLHRDTVRALCADACFAPIDPLRARLWALRAALTGEALSVLYYRHRRLAAWVRRVLRDLRPAVIFVSSSNMAPYVLDAAGGVRIVDLVDVDSQKWRALAQTRSGPMRLVYRREYRCVARLEARIAAACDRALLVSPPEAALFRRLQPGSGAKIHAVGNGVDQHYFDPSLGFPSPFSGAGPDVVFTGTMNYPPNVDAILWFATSVLPLIRARSPGVRLHVVGAHPAASIRALRRHAGIMVTGRVADVRPYLAHAAICVAPLRVARGIQNKVLEAMAMGRPVVATAAALEGIGAVPGCEVLVAETAEQFAAACLHAMTPEAACIGAAARRLVARDHLWAETLSGLDGLLAGAAP